MSEWTIYLSGEIHTNWRDMVEEASRGLKLPVIFNAPVIIHEDSDDCGAVILGEEEKPFWRDHKGAKINAIRTRTLIEKADVVVVRFGDKYRQWNAAFDAGYAADINKPLIVMHEATYTHALKEVDATALAVVETPDQVAKILHYVIRGELSTIS